LEFLGCQTKHHHDAVKARVADWSAGKTAPRQEHVATRNMKLQAKQTALQYAYDDVTRKLSNLPNPLPNPVKEVEWEAQLARLAAYTVGHGDCNVPQR
jgi:hypothetical protein